ncbi:MAG: N-acetylornithine carbamoyltransferase [Bacteroidota bacterium]
MNHFLSVDDVPDPKGLVQEALDIKKDPFAYQHLGKNKTLGMLFFNASLRTRMSTQVAARNLGMEVMVMNVSQDSWQIETEDGVIMNGNKAEHVKEAAAVLGQYCDVLGIRSFPTLKDKKKDYEEELMRQFSKYAGVPILSMESATLHPLQGLADMMTIAEFKKTEKPKVVLTWAPHIKPLPQAVPNSFTQWSRTMDFDFVITHPEGMELPKRFTQDAHIEYDQDKALEGADFVYVKNWSSYKNYGTLGLGKDWMFSGEKLEHTNDAKVMHCLPVRRNVVIADEVLDSPNSVVIQQAGNRVFSAQAVIKNLLESK